MDTYLTTQGQTIAEIEEKKSRFIAHLSHVESEEEALNFLEQIRAKHRMARHNVYAYIIRANNSSERLRYSDDGEPAKTAGLPTLQALQHAKLSDVIVVVTRYFGGTLLGTGGLVRAYAQATQAAINQAHIVSMVTCVDIRITAPYSYHDKIMRLIETRKGRILDTNYADSVQLVCRMADGTQDSLLKALRELFKGEAPYCVSEPKLCVL